MHHFIAIKYIYLLEQLHEQQSIHFEDYVNDKYR